MIFKNKNQSDILPITVYGDKILKKKTKNIKDINDKVLTQIRQMFATMRNANGIGIAANQVGFENSIFVADLSPVEGYEKLKPIVFINPVILDKSDEKEIRDEGCLSLPNLRADVERSKSLLIKFLNTNGKEIELEADELFARVIFHEYDHLIGKMIPDRVNSELKKKLQKELSLISNREVDTDYPITSL